MWPAVGLPVSPVNVMSQVNTLVLVSSVAVNVPVAVDVVAGTSAAPFIVALKVTSLLVDVGCVVVVSSLPPHEATTAIIAAAVKTASPRLCIGILGGWLGCRHIHSSGS